MFIIPPLVGTVFIWLSFPETKGLALEDIGILFGDLSANEGVVTVLGLDLEKHTTAKEAEISQGDGKKSIVVV